MMSLNATVLVVEDDHDLREALQDTLELAGCQVELAASAEQALQKLTAMNPDLVVSDINMGAMNGLQLLQQLRRDYPQLPVVMITAYGSIESSVEAMRLGAVDYLVKPFQPQVLVDTLAPYLGSASQQADGPVVKDPASQQLLQLAQRVAASDSTVLIGGESGTGKEVLARYIHSQSGRSQQAFVAVNCAAIPDNMLEAMLFGHEKGAFTGAYNSSPGKFEQANGGTLLLDEISEMPLALQAKLLRVLQEREVERLGGRKTIALDVRLLATSNRDLQQAVAQGQFREDLYYRLSVFPLQWLPLRQRPGDIVPLAEYLLQQHCRKMGRPTAVLDTTASDSLLAYDWPGNVRELDNVIQRALIMQGQNRITAADLRIDPYAFATAALTQPPALSESVSGDGDNGLDDCLQQREFELILDTLEREKSRKAAAEKLGISPRTLRYKLARMREEGIAI